MPNQERMYGGIARNAVTSENQLSTPVSKKQYAPCVRKEQFFQDNILRINNLRIYIDIICIDNFTVAYIRWTKHKSSIFLNIIRRIS